MSAHVLELTTVAFKTCGEIFFLCSQLHNWTVQIRLAIHVLQIVHSFCIAVHASCLHLFNTVRQFKQPNTRF
jgi:hypothetical protein